MKKLAIAVLGLAGVVSFSAQAQLKPEDAIKNRQAAMKLVGYNFGSVGAMVNDRKPYNKDEAIRNASRIDALSSQPFEFFGAGTDKGDTKAKGGCLERHGAKFTAASEKFQAEAAKLAQVARAGDMAALKAQFNATAGTCKACHDDFREK
ncbi:MAG: cytochrome c [Betaproteobacteria bacterium]|nr:cytochrome c [Betaproteobacteria bacterium]